MHYIVLDCQLVAYSLGREVDLVVFLFFVCQIVAYNLGHEVELSILLSLACGAQVCRSRSFASVRQLVASSICRISRTSTSGVA